MSADELVADTIRSQGIPLSESELLMLTDLRKPAVRNGIKELLRQSRVKLVDDAGVTRFEVVA